MKFSRVYRNRFAKNPKWVLTRTACLGNDVYQELGFQNFLRHNIQKGRIDLLIEHLKSNSRNSEPPSIEELRRKDVYEMLIMQNNRTYLYRRCPEFILLDSYSDLTDQEFEYLNTRFYTNYSDVSEAGLAKFTAKGLLTLDQIYDKYSQWMDGLRLLWGNDIKIYFVNFPSKFENRDFWVSRACEIKQASERMSRNYKNWINIEIPDRYVVKSNSDDFPYHFDTETSRYAVNFILKESKVG